MAHNVLLRVRNDAAAEIRFLLEPWARHYIVRFGKEYDIVATDEYGEPLALTDDRYRWSTREPLMLQLVDGRWSIWCDFYVEVFHDGQPAPMEEFET